MKRITVFMGANDGADQKFFENADNVARNIVEHDCELVYGGSGVGLMDRVAQGVLERKGRVIGITTSVLFDFEPPKGDITETHIVDSMMQRKQMLTDLGDAFVVMPGGVGTLEELFSVWTAAALHLHHKPIGILNAKGYFDTLLECCQHMHKEGFVSAEKMAMLTVATTADELFEKLNP